MFTTEQERQSQVAQIKVAVARNKLAIRGLSPELIQAVRGLQDADRDQIIHEAEKIMRLVANDLGSLLGTHKSLEEELVLVGRAQLQSEGEEEMGEDSEEDEELRSGGNGKVNGSKPKTKAKGRRKSKSR